MDGSSCVINVDERIALNKSETYIKVLGAKGKYCRFLFWF